MAVRTKLIIGLVLLTTCTAAALTLPLPAPVALRSWADDAGAAAPLLFLLAYSVLTAAPIPRTVFNLAAGLLLGEAAGIAVALTATVLSAALGFLVARALGRDVVARHLHRTPVRVVDERLTSGGLPAVLSLRLIPVIPFAPLSYCCGISSVRLRPYLAGTALGSLPGTVAIVLLGDALTGTTPPALLVCYAGFAILGVAGLLTAVRAERPARTATLDRVARACRSRRVNPRSRVAAEE
ncbi:TVP38/TMEM64 family protein [Qaidamihabitans albus]|uniref:TVP38/TMEM64 family protein n=1 Tax=Qaidamihabitans albus TaxID=2795733 RepID=UPI0018F26BFB|nr:TVP38/TMEM64 family protein [Qaidamihabitans albus]